MEQSRDFMQIRQCLALSDLPRLEQRMLLEAVLDKPRAWLLAHDDEHLSPQQYETYMTLVARRRHGEPMAYLVGVRAFMDFEVQVTPDVLIPRPETELLVEVGLASIAAVRSPRVLDLGTGSGAVAIAIARLCPDPMKRVVASDLSPAALQVAQSNARNLDVQIEFFVSDWYESLMTERGFDLIVSNPPYIDASDQHLVQGDLRFEPKHALTDGFDGLQAINRIVKEAPSWLKPGGHLWLEHGFDQGACVREILLSRGFTDVRTHLDLAGLERVSGGRWPAA